MAELTPISVKHALMRVKEWHRHLPELQGGLFATGVEADGALVGVGIAGWPCRAWMDARKIVITRVAAIDCPGVIDSNGKEHACPACTMIYSALCRAAKALGWREAWTYTMPEEPGRSLRAAGFIDMGLTDGGEWDRPSRRRNAAKHPEPKRRWLRRLSGDGEKS